MRQEHFRVGARALYFAKGRVEIRALGQFVAVVAHKFLFVILGELGVFSRVIVRAFVGTPM